MRLLNPWALLGLLAVALPVLVHLFSRRQARTMPFPTLRFLSDSRLLPTRRTRLTDLPLLAIRAAIVAFAALALAQPLPSLHERSSPPQSELARAIIIQAEPARDGFDDATNFAPRERALAALEDSSATHLRIPATSAPAAFRGAVAWLRTQPGLGEVVIVADFAGDAPADALDSTDIAGIPADIGISFVQVPSVLLTDTSKDGRVVWPTDAPTAVTDAVRRAVRDVGGPFAAEVRVLSAQTAFVDTIGALIADSIRTVVFASSDAATLANSAPWQPASSAPWIGTTMVAIARDSVLASTAANVNDPAVSGLVDTAFAAGATVLTRDANGAPLSAAKIVRAGNRPPILLLLARTPAAHIHSAALLLTSARLLGRPPQSPASSEASNVARASQRRAWTRAPTVPSNVREREAADVDSRDSLGRLVWLVVLALLLVEWRMRRRASASAVTAPSVGAR